MKTPKLTIVPTQPKLVKVRSSCIRRLGYDVPSRIAFCQFRSGSLYAYLNVKPATFTRWLNAKSKGRYFHRNVRSVFNYLKLAPISA